MYKRTLNPILQTVYNVFLLLEHRLNRLALMACHRAIEIIPDEIIDELSRQKIRKLDIVL